MSRPSRTEVRSWLLNQAGWGHRGSRIPKGLPEEMFHEEHGEVFVPAEKEEDYEELWKEIEGGRSNQRR